MTHSVNQSGSVKRFLIEQSYKVILDLALVFCVDALLHVVEHLDDLDVCTAVPRPFQGTQRRGDCRIGVRARRGDNVRGKSRVISAAVLSVKYHRKVKHFRFGVRKFAVLTQNVQKVFGG